MKKFGKVIINKLTKDDYFYWFVKDMFVVPVEDVPISFRAMKIIEPTTGEGIEGRVMFATYVDMNDQGGTRYRIGTTELTWVVQSDQT